MKLILSIAGVFFVALPPIALQQPAFKPVATVMELMSAVVIPSSDVIFGAASETPKNAAEWDKIKKNATILAESGNLLLMRAPSSNKESWIKYSRALIDAGEAAVKAANAKNVDGISSAGNDAYDTCEGCHKDHLRR